MCRLIVWNKPRPAADDPKLEAGRYQVGMVVAVLDDGQHPGTAVERLGWWRVIDLPGVARADMEYLTAPQPADVDSANLPRKRWNVIDLSGLTVRADGTVRTTKTVIEGRASRAQYVRDSRVIGSDPKVIG
jgi:hypothetical protein